MFRRKLLRAILTVATLMVVWLVVSPARALERAPVCDPRGATAFAPPTQIQDPELSFDIPVDCFDPGPLESKNYVPGHPSPGLDLSSMQEPARPVVVALPTAAAGLRVAAPEYAEVPLPAGFPTSLERPPRG